MKKAFLLLFAILTVLGVSAQTTVYGVAEAIVAATNGQITTNQEISVRGVISKIEFKGKNFANYGSACIYVTDEGGQEGTFEFFNCLSLDKAKFSSSDPAYSSTSTSWVQFNSVTDVNGNTISVGDVVIGNGKYTYYNNTTHELQQNCWLSLPESTSDAPTEAVLSQYYNTTSNVVLCVKFTGEAEVCNDIYFVGTFSGWAASFENCPLFAAVPGYDGWYAAEAPYATSFAGKPIQAQSDGSFSWDYQAGDTGAWTHVGGLSANIQTGYGGEANVYYNSAGAYIYEISYWKNHQTPCVVKTKHNYTLILLDPKCADEAYTAGVEGSFNNWETMVEMSPLTYQSKPGFMVTVEAYEESEYKFGDYNRGITNNEIYAYYPTAGAWGAMSNFVFPAVQNDTTLVFDFSDTNSYKWRLCTSGTTPQDSVLNVTQAVEIAQALADGSESEKEYTVKGHVVKIKAYNTQFGNQDFYLSDNPSDTYGPFMAYRCYVESPGVIVGCVVSIKGKFKKYGSTLEVVNGQVTIHSCPVDTVYYNLNVTAGAGGTVNNVSGQYTAGTSVKIQAYPNDGYVFSAWSDGNTTNPRTIVMNSDVTLTAYFQQGTPQEDTTTLTVAQAVEIAQALADGSESTVEYTVKGYVAKIEAYSTQYGNQNFYLSDSQTDTEGQFMVYRGYLDAPGVVAGCYVSVKGKFKNYRGTLEVVNGQVTIHSCPSVTTYYTLTVLAGIGGTVSDVSGQYEAGTRVTFKATPNEGYLFSRWTDDVFDNPRTVVMDKNITLSAIFIQSSGEMFPINVIALQGGTLNEMPTEVVDGTTLNMLAMPKNGYQFLSWSDGSTDNPHAIIVHSAVRMFAAFLPEYELTVSASTGGRVNTSANGTYTEAMCAEIEAIPSTGYEFQRWNDNVTDNPRVVILSRNMSLQAQFAKKHEGILDVETGVTIWDGGQRIAIRCEEPQDIIIYTAAGKLLTTQRDVTELNVLVSAGLYFVRTNNHTYKVIVK